MKCHHPFVILLCTLAFLPTVVVAQDSPGLPVGQKAPAFALADQNGKELTLQGLLKKGAVALVFYRSADW